MHDAVALDLIRPPASSKSRSRFGVRVPAAAAPVAFGALLLSLLQASPVSGQLPPIDIARYNNAERLLSWNVDPLISGDQVVPTWMRGGNRFWYRNKTANGAEFVVVDPVRGTRSSLFDADRLAAALSMAADTSFDGHKLPFRSFEFVDGERSIRFDARKKGFTCDLNAYTCTVGDTLPDRAGYVTSPDGRLEAFIHEHDLYVRPAGGGDSVRLTTDGIELFEYGIEAATPSVINAGIVQRPVLQWSPDSRRIAIQRMDQRNVGLMPLYSVTHQRPKLYTYPYPLPGDSIIPRFDIHIIDVEAKTNVRVDVEPQPYLTFTTTGLADSTWLTVKWKQGGERLYFTHAVRGAKRIQLMEADVKTGAARLIVKDTLATQVELNLDIVAGKPNWDVINNGQDVIWFSERDGYAHLYRFDARGNLKNRITAGAWTFGDLLYIDEAAGRLYFTARGREPGRLPVMAEFYAVNLDGTGLTRLGGEDADHTVTATPDGRWFIDQYSRPDVPPVTVLRDRTGRVVRKLEEADVSRLRALGWSPPEIFEYKARDGVTSMYGLIHRPSDFDSMRSYPVIEYIYPGPFIGSVGRWNFSGGALGSALRADQDALAELGFIVVQLDHLGTPFRAKAIEDNYWGNMGDNGLPDHILAVKQLGARYRWMDLSRVGIYGHSGGGFASTDAILRYPDFYKVAVSTSGNHDNHTYHAAYAEKYEGLLVRDTVRGTDNYANQVNASMAGNLKGHLFLMTGDMDDNVHPAMTMQVVDALIRANKTFDLMVLPNRTHDLSEPYVVRRRWDYFVQYLLGMQPPRDYEIRRPSS
jgi:dipeptidyl aminopeptidase/acylaminoacyl peptidase